MGGKPVVACDVCGVKEVIEHEKSGILVSPGNSAEIAEALISLINDRPKRLAMGRFARNLCEEKFSGNIMAHNMLALYESIQHENY